MQKNTWREKFCLIVEFTFEETPVRFDNQNLKLTAKFGGGNIMVWIGFSSKGIVEITVIDGNMNAYSYCRILVTSLFESARIMNMSDLIF